MGKNYLMLIKIRDFRYSCIYNFTLRGLQTLPAFFSLENDTQLNAG